MIEVNYNEYKETIAQNMKLIVENHDLKQEIERLKEEIKKEQDDSIYLEEKINKAIEYLESYNTDFKNCRFGEAPISMRELGDLLDILKGVDKSA